MESGRSFEVGKVYTIIFKLKVMKKIYRSKELAPQVLS